MKVVRISNKEKEKKQSKDTVSTVTVEARCGQCHWSHQRE